MDVISQSDVDSFVLAEAVYQEDFLRPTIKIIANGLEIMRFVERDQYYREWQRILVFIDSVRLSVLES